MATMAEFKREYTRAISEGYAAVFAGAGLSHSAGFVDWKSLVRPFANEIRLSVDKESDLISLTQFYANERGNRASINQKILNEFTKSTADNENIRILTRMPIDTYWTTNYDRLLEQGLEANNRKPDVKTTQPSLANNIYDRDAVVYKMHGDVCCPENAVLTKDDYEVYGQTRPLFRTALQGDLVTKTFLFIGFSFDDPNLNQILGQIRVLLGESVRDHYCFFEKIKKSVDECGKDFHYREIRQELRIKDLRRYGIQAIELDSYDEITDILRDIERAYLFKSIFISGAFNKAPDNWSDGSINQFAFNLAKTLVGKDYRLVSGFGLGIGSSIINGALDEIMRSKYKHVYEHLCLRPFPQNIADVDERKARYTTSAGNCCNYIWLI
jgi:NAD-dependent SIR2 family protein deacetylase